MTSARREVLGREGECVCQLTEYDVDRARGDRDRVDLRDGPGGGAVGVAERLEEEVEIRIAPRGDDRGDVQR